MWKARCCIFYIQVWRRAPPRSRYTLEGRIAAQNPEKGAHTANKRNAYFSGAAGGWPLHEIQRDRAPSPASCPIVDDAHVPMNLTERVCVLDGLAQPQAYPHDAVRRPPHPFASPFQTLKRLSKLRASSETAQNMQTGLQPVGRWGYASIPGFSVGRPGAFIEEIS